MQGSSWQCILPSAWVSRKMRIWNGYGEEGTGLDLMGMFVSGGGTGVLESHSRFLHTPGRSQTALNGIS